MPIMTNNRYLDSINLRHEVAVAAARMIAEEGMSYDQAKRKAVRQILGNTRISGEFLPDNELIKQEVRIYNELFLSDTQPARLLYLRKLAKSLMDLLEQFNPYLTGAVLNGTGGEHSDIHLQLYTENVKDVEIFLLNKNINFSVTESPYSKKRGHIIETIHFLWHDEVVHITVYDPDDIRRVFKSAGVQLERANRIELEHLIADQFNSTTKK